MRLNTEYLFREIDTKEENDVSGYDALVFNSGSSFIYGQILKPDGAWGGNRPCVIMFHGFAGFGRFDDVAQALCRAGCVVIIPHHRGAWGSEGYYSFTNCIEDAVNLANYARSEEFAERYCTDPDAIFLLGHSMGGNTSINAAARLDFIKGIILLAPCDISAIYKASSDESLMNFLVDNGGEILHSRGLDCIFADVKDNADKMLFTANAEKICKMNVFLAAGRRDDVCPPELTAEPLMNELEKYKTGAIRINRLYDADHSLMAVRVKLTYEIANFINAALNE